jgi:hypothetical protein
MVLLYPFPAGISKTPVLNLEASLSLLDEQDSKNNSPDKNKTLVNTL